MVIRSFDEIGHLTIADLGKQKNKDIVLDCGLTVREALQRIGCFYRDKIDPDYWVDKWKKRVAVISAIHEDAIVFTTDCRFPNEVKAGHDLEAKITRLTRCPHPEDTHESETALDDCGVLIQCFTTVEPDEDYFDAIIDNANMTEDETNKAVLELVTERGWA
jgi:hypothetical protein